MKKILTLLCICLYLMSGICSAADDKEPLITANKKKFDVFSATYVLDGNVYIQHKARSVKADHAEYNLLNQQVKAKGNIVFSDGDFSAACQTLTAYISAEHVDLSDNVVFNKNGLKITAQEANFNWQSKIAVFKGAVKINNHGKHISTNLATYNVATDELKF